jgi:malate dehydrogenase
MDISIVGASGSVGREVTSQLIRERLLESRQVLQLIESHPDPPCPYLLHGFRSDLQDAYAEIIPELDVTHDPQDIIGDIVVFAGGVTVPTDPREMMTTSRDMLAKANLPVFERFAKAIADTRRHHPPIVIMITNPVELGVHVFSKHLPREYVIGMGAYSDSLRFRWEIAHDLSIRRQRVHGYVIGEHGGSMVPLWSSVRVHGMDAAEWAAAEKRLRRGIGTAEFPQELVNAQKRLIDMLMDDPREGPNRALRHVLRLAPDLRVALKPFVTHYSGAKTLVVTASATLHLIQSIFEGRPIEIAAQYQHDGESGIHGPFGARLILAGTVERLLPLEGYSKEEFDLIQSAAQSIGTKIERWTSDDCE